LALPEKQSEPKKAKEKLLPCVLKWAAFTTSALENVMEKSEVCNRQGNNEGKREDVYMGAARVRRTRCSRQEARRGKKGLGLMGAPLG
jgi:hypothetical protein